MSNALEYENFVREAFERQSGKPVGRWGDPATLANTDYLTNDLLPRVKAAVAYSMEIFSSEIREGKVSDADYELTDKLLNEVLIAADTIRISQLIKEYKAAFFKKYLGYKI